MPQMTNERVRARLTREEDLSLLHEVSMKTAGVSHLEITVRDENGNLIEVVKQFC